MTTFKFHQDIKVSIWRRQHFSIEAESLEEAKAKAIKFQNEDVSNHNEFLYEEFMYESEELMLPDENGGQSTMQLYVKGAENPFATNGSDEEKHRINRWNEYIDAHCVAQKDMVGYNIETTYTFGQEIYHAFHKNDKLVIVIFYPRKEALRITFEENWDDLVLRNGYFRQHMAYFLKKKYKKNELMDNLILEWFTGHLTKIKASSEAVNDQVPFSLADLVEATSHMVSVYEYRAAKLIGYQVTNEKSELPEGFFSSQIFKDKSEAVKILMKTIKEEPDKEGMYICPIYEGDIEEPSFI